MLKKIYILLIGLSFAKCDNKPNGSTPIENNFVFTPKDTFVQDNFQELVLGKTCAFSNPDTSLSKIILRHIESTEMFLTEKDKIDSQECYHLYSRSKRELLTLKQFPGDSNHQISSFKIEYSDKANYDYQISKIDTFKTEKNINLGLTKKQIIKKLGYCYTSIDSTKNYIELLYKIEAPVDSKTAMLNRLNMPSYYASYKLWSNRLQIFEFGFDYP